MNVLTISAKQGDPSTFWQGESGRYYRTMAEAEADNADNAVNPDDYRYTKNFWSKNKKTIIWCIVAAVIVGAMIWLYKNGYIKVYMN